MEITLADFLGWIDVATQVGLLLIVLLIIVLLMRVIRLVGLANEIAEMVAEVVEMVNVALWKPIQWYGTAATFVKKMLGMK